MPDHERGEVVAAFVILHKNLQITENDILTALQGKIAHYKIPPKIFFVNDFPRKQAGKVLKRILKKQLEDN